VVGQHQADGRGSSSGKLERALSTARADRQRTLAGELEIKPKTSHNEWIRWMENMQDWCISRQLWWGHRCPAYLLKFEGEFTDVSQ
jgi:valyl-tRNA synthetase